MNNLLQRMPQSAKVGLVAALLVALVGSLYYFAIVRPNQIAQQAISPTPTPAPTTPTPTTTNPTPAQPSAAQPSASIAATPDAATQANTARSLEVVPLPFLVTESAKPETSTTSGTAAPTTTVAAKPQSDVPPNPFVPLVVEASTTTPSSTTPASARPGIINNPTPNARPTVVASNPIPTQTQRVRVIQPQALGLPTLPTASSNPVPPQTTSTQTATKTNPAQAASQTNPAQAASQTNPAQAASQTNPNPTTTAQTPPKDLVKPGGQVRLAPGGGRGNMPGVLSLGAGALPIRLAPLERELVKAAPTPSSDTTPAPDVPQTPADPALDTSVGGGASNPLDFAKVDTKSPGAQALEPRTSKPNPRPAPTQTQTPTTPVAAPNPVTDYIQAQNLKLANVVLGATNIAIFQSREGYMVVPVGNTLPGSSILLKSLNTKEALLVQGSQEQNLSIENP